MKRAFRTFLPVLLALALLLSLAACGKKTAAASGSDLPETVPPSASESDLTPATEEPAPTEEPVPTPDTSLNVNVMVMNGPTGFGMAKLISDAANGDAALSYSFSVESDASNAAAALISGGTDIAILPTNAAATVWNKTSGGVVVAAEVVRGNLYLIQNTERETVTSFADLEGKTLYAPAQNPTFITTMLCKANGLIPGENVTIDNAYAQPADLRTALAAGEVDLAVLPEPMVTIALSANASLSIALDLREAWQTAAGSDSLVMGCVAVRREWAEEHPLELAAFLDEYAASVAFVSDEANAGTAGELIAEAGIFAQAKVAQMALPRCSLCFVTGEEMQTELGTYLAALYDLNPNAVGGTLPDESFYYFY